MQARGAGSAISPWVCAGVMRVKCRYELTCPFTPPPPSPPAPDSLGQAITSFTAIAAGDQYTCALVIGGGAKCWGNNGVGQLGNGNTNNQLNPVDVSSVSGPITSFTAIAAGGLHTCALVIGGGAKCWGYNFYGQLGNGNPDITIQLNPVDVSSETAFTAIAVGSFHTCALVVGGGAKCWGFNADGQLGNGNTNTQLNPVDVSSVSGPSITSFTAIAVGGYHTCALVIGGGAMCWGSNGNGQLGNGGWSGASNPVDVTGAARRERGEKRGRGRERERERERERLGGRELEKEGGREEEERESGRASERERERLQGIALWLSLGERGGLGRGD
jgi:hypothetical protein